MSRTNTDRIPPREFAQGKKLDYAPQVFAATLRYISRKGTHMDCRVARRLIPAFLDGELGLDRETLLNEHLAECGSCRAEIVALKRTMDTLGICSDLEPTFTLADIKARAAVRQTRRGWFSLAPRWATALGAAVAIFIGAVGGIGLNTMNQPTQPPVVSIAVSDVLSLGVSDDPLADLMVASASEPSTTSHSNGRGDRP
jgi:predicted anti-sigma-YlaC factor YlaD